jgi:hypothetical protein
MAADKTESLLRLAHTRWLVEQARQGLRREKRLAS